MATATITVKTFSVLLPYTQPLPVPVYVFSTPGPKVAPPSCDASALVTSAHGSIDVGDDVAVAVAVGAVVGATVGVATGTAGVGVGDVVVDDEPHAASAPTASTVSAVSVVRTMSSSQRSDVVGRPAHRWVSLCVATHVRPIISPIRALCQMFGRL